MEIADGSYVYFYVNDTARSFAKQMAKEHGISISAFINIALIDSRLWRTISETLKKKECDPNEEPPPHGDNINKGHRCGPRQRGLTFEQSIDYLVMKGVKDGR